MHFFICYHRSKRPQTVYLFNLRLSARPFSGLVNEAVSTPICLHLTSGVAGIFPFVFFLQYVFQTPWSLKKTWGLRSIIEVPPFDFDVQHFPEEALKFLEKYSTVHSAQAAEVFFFLPDPPIISAVYALVFGLNFPSDLVWMVFLGSCLSQKVPCFAPASNVLVSLIPDFLFCCSVTKKVSMGCFTSLWQDF